MSFFHEALHSLKPGLIWRQQGDDPTNESEFHSRVDVQTGKTGSLVDFDSSISTIDIEWDDIKAEMDRIKTAHDALLYSRERAEAYPLIGDQMDMIYKDNKNGTTTHADAVEAVKTKWPKDNSGPVE